MTAPGVQAEPRGEVRAPPTAREQARSLRIPFAILLVVVLAGKL